MAETYEGKPCARCGNTTRYSNGGDLVCRGRCDERYKIAKRMYKSTPKGKMAEKVYHASAKGRARDNRYKQSIKGYLRRRTTDLEVIRSDIHKQLEEVRKELKDFNG